MTETAMSTPPDDIAAIFSLDPTSEPAVDLSGYASSENCTNNGCTNTCRGC